MDDRVREQIALGRDHYERGEYEKAERLLSEVVRSVRAYADVHNMLGVIYHDQGRFAQAQEAFEEALRINPNYTEAALNLAVTYNDLGKYHEAREVYTRAMTRSRGEPRMLDPFAKGKIANMHADVGDAYAGVGLFDEAVREYERALALCPSFVDLRTKLALALRDLGRAPDALRELREVKQANPSFLPGRIHLGVTYYSLGRIDEATAEWHEVLALDPQNRSAKMYLQMVVAQPRAGARPTAPRVASPESDNLNLDEAKEPGTTGRKPDAK
jgi:tetratricopeptide (TPR) repeat protein